MGLFNVKMEFSYCYLLICPSFVLNIHVYVLKNAAAVIFSFWFMIYPVSTIISHLYVAMHI